MLLLSKKVLERTSYRNWACAIDFGDDLKKRGFAVDGSAVRKRRYLNTFYLWVGQARSIIAKEAAVAHIR